VSRVEVRDSTGVAILVNSCDGEDPCLSAALSQSAPLERLVTSSLVALLEAPQPETGPLSAVTYIGGIAGPLCIAITAVGLEAGSPIACIVSYSDHKPTDTRIDPPFAPMSLEAVRPLHFKTCIVQSELPISLAAPTMGSLGTIRAWFDHRSVDTPAKPPAVFRASPNPVRAEAMARELSFSVEAVPAPPSVPREPRARPTHPRHAQVVQGDRPRNPRHAQLRSPDRSSPPAADPESGPDGGEVASDGKVATDDGLTGTREVGQDESETSLCATAVLKEAHQTGTDVDDGVETDEEWSDNEFNDTTEQCLSPSTECEWSDGSRDTSPMRADRDGSNEARAEEPKLLDAPGILMLPDDQPASLNPSSHTPFKAAGSFSLVATPAGHAGEQLGTIGASALTVGNKGIKEHPVNLKPKAAWKTPRDEAVLVEANDRQRLRQPNFDQETDVLEKATLQHQQRRMHRGLVPGIADALVAN